MHLSFAVASPDGLAGTMGVHERIMCVLRLALSGM